MQKYIKRNNQTQLTKAREDEKRNEWEPDHEGWDEAQKDNPEEGDDHGQDEARQEHPPACADVHEHTLSHLWGRDRQGGWRAVVG